MNEKGPCCLFAIDKTLESLSCDLGMLSLSIFLFLSGECHGNFCVWIMVHFPFKLKCLSFKSWFFNICLQNLTKAQTAIVMFYIKNYHFLELKRKTNCIFPFLPKNKKQKTTKKNKNKKNPNLMKRS